MAEKVDLDVLINLKANSAGAKEAQGALNGVRNSAAAAHPEIAKVGAAHRAAAGDARNFTNVMHSSTEVLGENGKGFGDLQNKIRGVSGLQGYGGMAVAALGASAAMGIGLETVKHGIEDYVRFTNESLQFARATGMSVQESSLLAHAFGELGVDAEAGEKAMFKFGKAVADGATFQSKFGIELAKNKNGTTDLAGTLGNLADKYVQTEDPAKRDLILLGAFGKAGAALAPAMEQGKAGLSNLLEEMQRFGVTTDQDVKNVIALQVAQEQWDESTQLLSRDVGGALVPAVSSFTVALTAMLQGTSEADMAALKASGSVGNFNEAMMLGQVPLIGSALAMRAYGDTINVAHSATAQSIIDARNNAGARQEEAQATREAAAANDALASATEGLIGSEVGVERATDAANAAIKTYNSGVGSQHENILAAKEAINQEAAATANYADEQAKLVGPALTAEQHAAIYRDKLAELTAHTKGPLHAAMQAYLNQLASTPAAISTTVELNVRQALDALHSIVVAASVARQAEIGAGSIGGFRQFGGDVKKGQAYVIGEGGPELYVPTEDGEIISNPESRSLVSTATSGRGIGGGGGGGMVVNINITESGDPRQTALQVRDELLKLKRTIPSLGLA